MVFFSVFQTAAFRNVLRPYSLLKCAFLLSSVEIDHLYCEGFSCSWVT